MSVRWVSVILAGILMAASGSAAVAAEAQKSKSARRDTMSAECGWIGKRIIQLLSRDDVVTAGEFRQFYVAFGCSEAHLSAAFGCAIEGGAGAEACAARSECVDLCWKSPTASTLDKSSSAAPPAAKPAPAAQSKSKTPPPPPKKPTTAKPLALPTGPYDKK
ncbi:MAG: hypothetical protein AB7D00_00900 [Rhodospirillaceae bacterium]